MNDFSILPNQVEECIRQLIDQRFQEENLYSLFPNRLLREDVLDLLDRYCTVVYYPLEGEGNNGFRVKDIPFADGSRHDFVFINTAQTLEKQAFTAAHELGHITLHRSQLKMAPMSDNRLYNMINETEYQANLFAADLLIQDEDVAALSKQEDLDYFSFCSSLYATPELMSFKLYSLMKRGQKYNMPLDINSNFLAK